MTENRTESSAYANAGFMRSPSDVVVIVSLLVIVLVNLALWWNYAHRQHAQQSQDQRIASMLNVSFAGGLRPTGYFDGPDGLIGIQAQPVAKNADGTPQAPLVLYASPHGKYLFVGKLLDATGTDVGEAQERALQNPGASAVQDGEKVSEAEQIEREKRFLSDLGDAVAAVQKKDDTTGGDKPADHHPAADASKVVVPVSANSKDADDVDPSIEPHPVKLDWTPAVPAALMDPKKEVGTVTDTRYFSEAEKLSGVTVGDPHAPLLVALADPLCNVCIAFHKDVQSALKHKQIRIHWVPVSGVGGAKARTFGAAYLALNVYPDNPTELDAKQLSPHAKQIVAALPDVDKNTAFAAALMGQVQTPTLIYHRHNGEIVVRRGYSGTASGVADIVKEMTR